MHTRTVMPPETRPPNTLREQPAQPAQKHSPTNENLGFATRRPTCQHDIFCSRPSRHLGGARGNGRGSRRNLARDAMPFPQTATSARGAQRPWARTAALGTGNKGQRLGAAPWPVPRSGRKPVRPSHKQPLMSRESRRRLLRQFAAPWAQGARPVFPHAVFYLRAANGQGLPW